MELIALLVSIVAALAAIVSIPSLQPSLAALAPRVAGAVKRYGPGLLVFATCVTAIILALYYFLFFPCPWYKVSDLRSDAVRLAQGAQWSTLETVGRQLCDCGAVSEGWDLQAKAEYEVQQFRIAVNFWKRSAEADPSKAGRRNANIADALIWLNDFKSAVDIDKKLYDSEPTNDLYRYSYGRALIFNRDFKAGADLLSGMETTFADGGTKGGVPVFNGIAQLGLAAGTAGSVANDHVTSGQKYLCQGIAMDSQWRSWLFDPVGDAGHLSVFRELLAPQKARAC
jgi:hypothetical protein